MNNIYKKRRSALSNYLKQMGGGLAVIFTSLSKIRNADCEYPFRPDSNFYYLTGFSEPRSAILIDHQGFCTLFCQPRDQKMETWTGVRTGPGAATAELDVNVSYSIDDLPQYMAQHCGEFSQLYSLSDNSKDCIQLIASWVPRQYIDLIDIVDLKPFMSEMRLFKDVEEIKIIQRACDISAAAHTRAIQYCANHSQLISDHILREYHLESELLHEFRNQGATGPAYSSIVAGGKNATTLHHCAGNSILENNQLCLIDAGCEYQGYASDVTRTFPINGKFSAPQRKLYEIVLAAQTAAIDAAKPHNPCDAPHQAALRVLIRGMLDTGLLNLHQHGTIDQVLASGAYRQFYPHGTSHWMGMDVHDCGNYRDPRDASKPRILEPNMVLTIEPGLYVEPHPDVPMEYWNMGIRIEDDILITANGCQVLTRGVPVDPDDIEKLMQTNTSDLIYRLKKRAEIRRNITSRKSVQENKPDRLSDLLDEAADIISRLK